MKTSPAGIKRLEQREGVRLKAYQDSRGIWTIGVGMITWRGHPVAAGMTITQAELDAEFAAQIVAFERAVRAAVQTPLTQNQFDALVSFCWHIGPAGFARSTTVRELNEGRIQAAAEAMMLWDKPPEIRSRREGEVAQFLTPDAGSSPVIAPPSKLKASPAAKPAAVVVAGGAVVAAGAANAASSTLWPWVLVLVAVAAFAVFLVLHIRKA